MRIRWISLNWYTGANSSSLLVPAGRCSNRGCSRSTKSAYRLPCRRRNAEVIPMSGPKLEHFSTRSLSIACEVSGPTQGKPVLVLHGWPDDARTWDRVLPALHAAGHRTIVPYLRGFGPTRFHSPQTPRSGQLVALAHDALELADAMELRSLAVVGHDWGARVAYIASAFADVRVLPCVELSAGLGTARPGQPLTLKQVQKDRK